MTVYRYPHRALIGDYLRSSVGLGVGLGVLITVPPSPAIVVVFGGITLLFLVFGFRTVQRHLARVALTSEGIWSRGLTTRSIPWPELDRLTLRYYGTRRQRREGSGGFFQLTLHGGKNAIRLESSIEGFDEIVRQAGIAARANGISVDPASAGNLLDMGIDADAPAQS
jgi:hypothetical protein